MDDITIINKLRSDPASGLRTLIGEYRGLVGKVTASLLFGHNEDIEEVIADTFISVWKNIDKLDAARGSLKGLLIITARRNAINRWHKLKNDRLVTTEELDLFAKQGDVLDDLLREEDNELLQELVNALSEPDREIFVRRHYLLEPVREISITVGLSEKQISNRLYQCRLRLKNDLQERGIAR